MGTKLIRSLSEVNLKIFVISAADFRLQLGREILARAVLISLVFLIVSRIARLSSPKTEMVSGIFVNESGRMLVSLFFWIGKRVTILLPIFFYHKLAQSLLTMGFGLVVTPPAPVEYLHRRSTTKARHYGRLVRQRPRYRHALAAIFLSEFSLQKVSPKSDARQLNHVEIRFGL